MRIISVIFLILFHIFISAKEIGIFAAPYERELIATLLSSYNSQTDSPLYFFTLWEVIDNYYKNPPPSNPSVVDSTSEPELPNPPLFKPDGTLYKRGPYKKSLSRPRIHVNIPSSHPNYHAEYRKLYDKKIRHQLPSIQKLT